MTNDEYIASGILELYAAGGLTEGERREVEEMAANNPEIRTALQEVLQAMEAYANLHAVTPPANLKARILNNLSGQEKYQDPIPVQKAKVININRADKETKTKKFSWLAAAAVSLLVLSGALNFYFYNNWKSAESNLAIALNSQQQLAGNYQTVQQKLSETEIAMQVLQSENTRNVKLQGMPKAPEALAVIHWDSKAKTVLLNVKNLPVPSEGKQYQLWALDNGKPIDAGVINLDSGTVAFQQMKSIESAQAFAVTLEPAGGSVNPTLAEMYLMGSF